MLSHHLVDNIKDKTMYFLPNLYNSFLMNCLVYILVLITLLIQPVHAQSNKASSTDKTKRVQAVSQKNVKQFEKIAELFEKNKDQEAKVLLDKLALSKNLNNFEKAYIANFLGAYYFERDKLDQSLRQYKKIIRSPEGIPHGFYSQAFYTLAQVYFSKEDYKNALKYANQWFQTIENPPADAYMLIGQAHYMLKQYTKALPNVKKGIQKYISAGSTPKEGWLNLLSSIYHKKKDFKNMLKTVKQLLRYYPKRNYLLTIAGVYNELGQQKNMMAIYLSMYDSAMLSTSSELVTLSSLLLSNNNAYKASKVLKKGLETGIIKANVSNYRLYAQSLLIAKEFEAALLPLNQAAKLSGDGKLYYQLAQSYAALNRLNEAEKSYYKALKKGKLKNTGSVLIALGSVQFELKKLTAAKESFKKALKYGRSKKDAVAWIQYVDTEVYRLEELAKPIVINTEI